MPAGKQEPASFGEDEGGEGERAILAELAALRAKIAAGIIPASGTLPRENAKRSRAKPSGPAPKADAQ